MLEKLHEVCDVITTSVQHILAKKGIPVWIDGNVLFVSSHIKMMHLSDPSCSLFIAFIYVPWLSRELGNDEAYPLEYQWME